MEGVIRTMTAGPCLCFVFVRARDKAAIGGGRGDTVFACPKINILF
jgi:hypothetical protein